MKHVKTRHADLAYFLLTGSTHEKTYTSIETDIYQQK